MNFARAFGVMAALAVAAVLAAVTAIGSAIHAADSGVVAAAQDVLDPAARRIAAAYRTQILTLRSDLTVPLSRATLDGYGRRIVVATIGDDEGVDGGLDLGGVGIVADGPQPVVGLAERRAIETLANLVAPGDATRATHVHLPDGDVVAIAAAPLGDHRGIAWARERIPASALRGEQSTLPLIVLAALACGLLIGFCLWIVWSMRRDARLVLAAIAALELDPGAATTIPGGDYGAIGRAVSLMAQRRASAEAAAQRSERLAALGRLAANAAHEIRNPLNALRLQLDVLRRRLSPEFDVATTKLQGEITRLDAVVGGMLAVATDAPPAPTRIDLRTVAERAIDVLEADARARSRRFVFTCTTGATTVDGDAGRLVQLAINILANAVDAAPPHSAIDVRISAGPVLSVVDHGEGIAEADLGRLFEPFFTTKSGGTGLGLAIASEIARSHGARIDVASRAGETTFSVAFGDART